MPKEPEAVEDLPAPSGNSGGGGGGGSMMPVLAIVILIPIITIGLAEFYIFPKVTEIVSVSGGGHAESGEHGSSGGHGEDGHAIERGEAVAHYEFNNVVANLRGSMNSRYIQVSFTVESKVLDFEHYMDVNKAKILDATISVLSNLTMQDLDEPGIKNIVRSDLLNSFGSALHANVIDNLYFSEFVVQ